MSPYEYRALSDDGKSIRLVQLKPSKGSKVHFSLIEGSIDDNSIDYDALSYSWESFNGTADVLCDGQELTVTKNCHAALCRLRPTTSEQGSRPLWIDAICINQQDTDEKIEQLKLMRAIYSRAQRVLVWLGNDADNGATLLRSMKAHIGRYGHFSMDRSNEERMLGSSNSWAKENMERAQTALFERSDHSQLRACVDILHRSWFRRTWILQEVVLGKEVYMICGSQAMSFLDFFRSIINRRSTKDMAPELLEPVQVMHTLRAIHTQKLPQTPSLILRLSEPFLATDAKDKIFGVCGLSEALAKVQDRASYHNSVAKIYTEAATQCLLTEESIVFLVLSVPPSTSCPDLPSWVPNFSRQKATFWDLYTRRRQGTSSRVANTAWIEGDILCAPVWILDTVSESTSRRPGDKSRGDGFVLWRSFLKFCDVSKFKNREDWLNRFVELLAWRMHDAPKFAHMSDDNEFLDWLLSCLRSDDPPSPMSDAVQPNGSTKIHEMMLGTSGMEMSKTLRGNYGLSPQYTQPGDLVAVFPGCSIPFVIRRAGQDFNLVGACHLTMPYTMPSGRPQSAEDCVNWQPSQERTTTYGLQSLDDKTQHHLPWEDAEMLIIRIV